MSKSSKFNVVVIGGGTGTFSVLSGLRDYTNLNLSAIVTTMDSGGSTGRLRDQLGVLPPGDLRQALVALSASSQIWRDLFTYRFDAGDLSGHNFGNIFISALEKVTGSFEQAIELAGQLLNTQGSVIPVTLCNCVLCVELMDGSLLEGEAVIDECTCVRSPIKFAFLKPDAKPNPKALTALENADLIILGPGDLYTSIIPNILVGDIASAITSSKAKKLYVVNLMTKLGQTDNFTAKNHIIELSNYLGVPCLNYVVMNNSLPADNLLEWYKNVGESVPVYDDLDTFSDCTIIRADLLSVAKYEQSLADRLKRSLIRHDSAKLSQVVYKLLNSF